MGLRVYLDSVLDSSMRAQKMKKMEIFLKKAMKVKSIILIPPEKKCVENMLKTKMNYLTRQIVQQEAHSTITKTTNQIGGKALTEKEGLSGIQTDTQILMKVRM